jgi:hypothetical protein
MFNNGFSDTLDHAPSEDFDFLFFPCSESLCIALERILSSICNQLLR